jgi:uncharacterized membrane protein YdfJ with MMPL/SSD domain
MQPALIAWPWRSSEPDLPDGDQPVRNRNVLDTQGTADDIESARAAIVLIAVVLVVFWRAVLRVLLTVIVIVIVVLVGSGALVLLQSIHR